MNLEQLQQLSTEQLQARLSLIIPQINLLTDVWRNKTLTADITAAWSFPVPGDKTDECIKTIHFQVDEDSDSFDDFLLFIHNYCTRLCAEKLLLETLLYQKTADIANP